MRFAGVVVCVGVCVGVCAGAASADTVRFYGGDWSGRGTLGDYASVSGARDRWVYDDFQWDGGTLTRVFANYLSNSAVIEGMEFEIRTGVGVGQGGTVVARGGGSSTWVWTGALGPGNDWYRGTLDIADLNLAAGTYFLGIRPIIAGLQGYASIAVTGGANGVGTPRGNDNSFMWDIGGVGYQRAALGVSPPAPSADFSQGVYGVELVPLPPAAWAGMATLAGLAGFRVVRRRSGR